MMQEQFGVCFLNLGNIALGSLLFSQFISERSFSALAALAGAAGCVSAYVTAYLIMKGKLL